VKGGEVAIDTNGCPRLQLSVEILTDGPGLSSERVPHEVNGRGVITVTVVVYSIVFMTVSIATQRCGGVI
jgi:hypothetical protein